MGRRCAPFFCQVKEFCVLAALAVAAVEVGLENLVVDIRRCCSGHRNNIGANQSGALEHALHFLTCRHMTLVRALFDPDTTLMIHVGFCKAIGDAYHHHDTIGGLHVFGQRMHRRAHVLCGSVAKQLIQPPYRSGIQPRYRAIIAYAKEQPTSATVGKGRQLGGDAIGVGCVAFELVKAVFATCQYLQQFSFVHGYAPLRYKTLISHPTKSLQPSVFARILHEKDHLFKLDVLPERRLLM